MKKWEIVLLMVIIGLYLMSGLYLLTAAILLPGILIYDGHTFFGVLASVAAGVSFFMALVALFVYVSEKLR